MSPIDLSKTLKIICNIYFIFMLIENVNKD